jgi:hypothetical protein
MIEKSLETLLNNIIALKPPKREAKAKPALQTFLSHPIIQPSSNPRPIRDPENPHHTLQSARRHPKAKHHSQTIALLPAKRKGQTNQPPMHIFSSSWSQTPQP